MRRFTIVLVLTTLFLSGCSSVDRPEGVVERWLISINQGRAGEPEALGRARLADRILPGWERCDPGALDVIEVAPGEQMADLGIVAPYHVPFRVVAAANFESLCGEPPPFEQRTGNVSVAGRLGGYRILGVSFRGAGGTTFPSEGGRTIAGASTGAWLASIGAAIALCLAVMLLMVTVGKRRSLVEQVTGADVGHQRGGPA